MKCNIEEIARKFESHGWHLVEARLALREFITTGSGEINRLVMDIFRDPRNHSENQTVTKVISWMADNISNVSLDRGYIFQAPLETLSHGEGNSKEIAKS